MLAFVFWHWRRREVGHAAYAARLAVFHEALRDHAPEGFRFSAAFRSGLAPWLAASGDSYEDWYVTDGSAALDPLNEGAVSGACKEPHDACARLADGGAAGLYRLRRGSHAVGRARVAVWFAKPEGMTYAGLDALVEPLAREPLVGLWARQMVLGPTPEFCLLSAVPIRLPAPLAGMERTLEPVWTGS